MNRRSFLAWSGFAPLSAAAKLIRPRGRYRQEAADSPSSAPVSTGQANLDEILGGGLMPGEVTLVAMNPLCATIADLGLSVLDHHLRRSRGAVAFVSALYDRESMVDLLACARAGIPVHPAIRNYYWDSVADRQRYEAARQAIERSSLHWEGAHYRRSLADVAQSLWKAHERCPLGLIVFGDLSDLKDIYWGSDVSKRAAASTGQSLRELARAMHVPILAGCPVVQWSESPPVAGALTSGYRLPSLKDLGPLVPILDHCDVLLLEQILPKFEGRRLRFAIEVAFHPRVSRGSVSLHTVDLNTGRVSEGA